jgi:hypothetical protein
LQEEQLACPASGTKTEAHITLQAPIKQDVMNELRPSGFSNKYFAYICHLTSWQHPAM